MDKYNDNSLKKESLKTNLKNITYELTESQFTDFCVQSGGFHRCGKLQLDSSKRIFIKCKLGEFISSPAGIQQKKKKRNTNSIATMRYKFCFNAIQYNARQCKWINLCMNEENYGEFQWRT